MLRTALLWGNTINLDSDYSKYIETVSDPWVIEGFAVEGGKVKPGKAWVKVTRSNGESLFVLVQNMQDIPVSLNGDVFIGIEVAQNAIDNGLMNNEDGTGIASIKVWPQKPNQNYLLLAVQQGGRLSDKREIIPKLQSLSSRTTTLEDKVQQTEGKVERLESGGQINFCIPRELWEDIEQGKAYFRAKWFELSRIIDEGEIVKWIMPQISWPKPAYTNPPIKYRQNTWSHEFTDWEYRWEINEIMYRTDSSNKYHFQNDPSAIYRDWSRESSDNLGKTTVTLSKIDNSDFLINYLKFRGWNTLIQVWGISDWWTEIQLTQQFSGWYSGGADFVDLWYKTNIWFYKKYKIQIENDGNNVASFWLSEIGAKLPYKKLLNSPSIVSSISCLKWDTIKLRVNKLWSSATLSIQWLINRTITAQSETIEHYCDTDWSILLNVPNGAWDNYYTISELTITRWGDKGKKYKSDPSIDRRNEFLGIEKSWGQRGQTTMGIEDGFFETSLEWKIYAGQDGSLNNKGGVYLWYARGGYCKIWETIEDNWWKIIINKTIQGDATGKWLAPKNWKIFVSYEDHEYRAALINDEDLRRKFNNKNGSWFVQVQKWQVIFKTIRIQNQRDGKITLEYFIPSEE